MQTLLLAAVAGREVNEDFTVAGQRISCYVTHEDAYFWGPPLGGTVSFVKEWPGVWKLDRGGSRQFEA